MSDFTKSIEKLNLVEKETQGMLEDLYGVEDEQILHS